MKNTLNYLGILLIGIIIGIVGSLIIRSKLTTPIQTIIKYDTIRITEPQAEKIIPVAVKKFTTVPTLLTISDTIKVPYYIRDTLMIPIEQKYYRSPQYQAWVSGYLPSLDSILIHNTTHTIIQPQSNGNPSILGVYAEVGSVVIPKFGIYAGLEADIRIKQYRITARGGMTNIENAVKPYVLIGLKYQISGMR